MHVLIVENDDDQRELLSAFIGQRGYMTHVAAGVSEARAAVLSRQFDAYVTDYDLGDGFGTELLDVFPPERTILMSAHGRLDVPPELQVMRKPLDAEVFLCVLQKLSGRRGSADVSISVPHRSVPPVAPDRTPRPAFVLYVAGSTACDRARRRLTEALARFTPAVVPEVVDLSEDPLGVKPGDCVLFTPALVRRSPEPGAWLLGDLSHAELLTDFLLLAGLTPRAAEPPSSGRP